MKWDVVREEIQREIDRCDLWLRTHLFLTWQR